MDTFLQFAIQALILILTLSAPMLLISLLVGLIVSLFQALTQIQEQTLTFVPKAFATVLIIILLSSWMMGQLRQFTENMFSQISVISTNRH